jgi:o-succinylbenzoate synthase
LTEIVSARADKVRVPFRRPFVTAAGMWSGREAWIIRLFDADGRTGVGEAVLEPADGETASTVLDHLVREAASIGPGDRLPDAVELDRHGGPGRALRAAIDAARLDLEHPTDDRLADGGAGVGVNATIASLGPAASAEAARQAMEAGFTTLKLKAGAERETEALVDRVRAVRRAVGPDVRLRLDVNGAWDLETATDRLDAIDRFGLEYVEQPLAGDDEVVLAELRRRVTTPIAADETVTSIRTARGLLEADAVDVLVVKPARVGGPVAAAEIAELAAGRGVPVVISTLFETGIGIAAALAIAVALPAVPGSRLRHAPDHGLATAGLLEHDLLVDGLVLDAGRMWVPGGAAARGLGIEVDELALARFRVESVGAA